MIFLSRAKKLFQQNGWQNFKQKIERTRRQKREAENYQKWIFANRLTEKKRETLCREIERFNSKPLISIVLPVYNIEKNGFGFASNRFSGKFTKIGNFVSPMIFRQARTSKQF